MKKYLILCILLLASTFNSIQACSTPVFQYALERWEPDPHILSVYYDGSLDDQQQAIIDTFNEFVEDFESSSPLSIELINIQGELTEEQLRLYSNYKDAGLPRVVLQTPNVTADSRTLHDGELSEEFFSSLLHSDLRRQLADKLLNGESFVWLLIESGNTDKDDAAEATLKKTIAAFIPQMQKELTERLTFGSPESSDPEDVPVSPEDIPQVKTSIIRLSRSNSQEQLLLNMLFADDAELIESTEPICIPIFGEGRALWSLMGSGINDELITESMSFLCGSCSCQIKAQNPGYDIFIPVDWQKLINNRVIGQSEVPPLMGPSAWGPMTKTENQNNIHAQPTAGDPTIASDASEKNQGAPSLIFVIAGILAAILIIGTVLTMKRGSA